MRPLSARASAAEAGRQRLFGARAVKKVAEFGVTDPANGNFDNNFSPAGESGETERRQGPPGAFVVH